MNTLAGIVPIGYDLPMPRARAPATTPKMGRPIELAEPWRSLAERAGSVEQLAELLGVSKMTISRWSRAPELRRANLLQIGAVAAQLGVKLPKEMTP